MTPDQRLKRRDDVPDEEIGWVIARAQELQEAASADDGVATVDEVLAVSRELELDDVHVEAAIRELHERRKQVADESEHTARATPGTSGIRNAFLPLLALGVLVLLCVLGGTASTLMGIKGEPPKTSIEQPTPERVWVAPPSVPPGVTPPSRVQPPTPKRPAVPAPIATVKEQQLPPSVEATELEDGPDVKDAEESSRPWRVMGQLPTDTKRAVNKGLLGHWVLTSNAYRGDGMFLEMPLGREKINEDRERWTLLDSGRFRHVMGPALGFSGDWEVGAEVGWPDGAPLRAEQWFELRLTNVATSFGEVRASDHFLGALADDRLLLIYLGQDPAKPHEATLIGVFSRE